MSAVCLEKWTWFIWIRASRFCRSNNRSRFTRWVREICPMDGLRSFMIILITASFSSKTNIDPLSLEMCEFEKQSQYCSLTSCPSWEISSLVLRVGSLPAGDSRKSSVTSHKLSAGIISNLRRASTEKTSASVLLCENTCLLFTHVQLTKTNVWHLSPDVEFGVLETSLQNRRLGKDLVYNAERCCQQDNIVCW